MELKLLEIVRERIFDAYRLPGMPISADTASDVFRLMEKFSPNGDYAIDSGYKTFQKGNKFVVWRSAKLPKGECTLDILTTSITDDHNEPVYTSFILINPGGKVKGSYKYSHERSDGALSVGDGIQKAGAEVALKAIFEEAYRVAPKKS